ncbi:alpha/beta hydrolase family esterase [Nocardia bovistercoris]|uniref:Polyhydroxybutyrate depolymerase n=1 Tax=Nocardia bovistercoris TaxID=2785916 RepID=A0A931I4K6_9NOCA|nr:hypothetical protein [Nocardia bovistercoris]MBH0774764.1 hypothetical protein [Nocardia bovistercoris]
MIGNRLTGSDAGRRIGRRPLFALAAAFVAVAAVLTAAAQPARAEDSDIAPRASTGCAAPAPAPGESTLSFAALGKSGSYIRNVPPGADRPLPLILDLHGYLEPAALEHASTGFGPHGMANGYLTITPQIDELALPRWEQGENSVDIAYLGELLTHIESTVCVDLRRVYAAGLSMGGFTSSALACRFSDRIAAIAPVAGLQDFAWCDTTRPVPVISFHGTADPIVAYEGGLGPNARLLPASDGSGSAGSRGDRPSANGPGAQSITADADAWARRNGCGSGDPAEQWVAPEVVLRSYPCPQEGEVQLYSIVGGGHVWPGTAATFSPAPLVGASTVAVDATELIWDFFRAHPMRT